MCRGVSTSVEGRLIENAKIKVQSAKLRNPDLGGMGVLVVGSFSISRILYLLDVYYISQTVGCQVNSSLTTDCADSRGLLTTNWHELARNGHRGPAKTTAGKHREKEVSGYQEGEPRLGRVEGSKISKSPPNLWASSVAYHAYNGLL